MSKCGPDGKITLTSLYMTIFAPGSHPSTDCFVFPLFSYKSKLNSQLCFKSSQIYSQITLLVAYSNGRYSNSHSCHTRFYACANVQSLMPKNRMFFFFELDSKAALLITVYDALNMSDPGFTASAFFSDTVKKTKCFIRLILCIRK